ncbi:CHAT domain-containing protein [Desmonostoc muscorum LEGE 12446]|uniref:CHAT domain-containing protein n=1 Tax=Desmonostoc muscorum LEGE 12446 TaxID=1828758 RepID=A0A8J7A363_DESMC|nr:CHAT domain-containing protein [Desmonostoc muscorum]MCF2151315.1 CHAT domain-containing protein [Desmonostoc muscorum LEGE 12446]
MRDVYDGLRLRTSRIILIALSAFLITITPTWPQNFSGFFFAPQVLAQTPNQQQTETVTGSFIDYFAEERQFKGHEGSVNSASFSPDGKLIVTAGADNTARIWDFTGKQVAELVGHQGNVKSANFSPDGKLIVTASFDGTARVWDVSGKQLVELKGHQGNVYSANFSPDSKQIVTVSADKTVRIWDISGKQLTQITGHENIVNCAKFSPDSKRIITASADKTARVWNLSGRLLTELKGHTDTVWSASFSPDGKQIVTASDDKTARIWDVSGKQLAVLQGHQNSVLSASFSQNNQQIVTASVDYTALIWESSGKLVGKLQGHEGSVNSADWSQDGKWIVTASVDGTTWMWNAAEKLLTELRSFNITREISSISFSPDGKQILIGSGDNSVLLWDISSQQVRLFNKNGKGAKYAHFSPDGKFIVTSDMGYFQVWDKTGKLLTEVKDNENLIQGAYFSPDGQCIITSSQNDIFFIWNISGKLLTKIKGFGADLSPDGKKIITFSGKTAYVWDISGKQIAELKGHQKDIEYASFSPDGQHIITASFNGAKVYVWNSSGSLLTVLQSITSASFSPDGKLIASSGETSTGTTYGLWDLSGKLVAELEGFTLTYPGLKSHFSPDGKLILTQGWDQKTLFIHNISGKLLAEIKAPHGNISSIDFSPDGQKIITTSDDKSVRIWYLNSKYFNKQTFAEIPSAETIEPQGQVEHPYAFISVSSDGKRIITPSDKNTARVWDISGKLVAELKGNQNYVTQASFSSDGQHIVTRSDDDTILWDSSGKLLAVLDRYSNTASFSPNSKQIVIDAKIYDISGKLLTELKGHQDRVYDANFSHDGKLIVTASEDATARIWNLSGKLLAELKGHKDRVITAKFSPNGKLVATSSYDKTVRIWDIYGKLLTEIPGNQDAIFSPLFKFSPDGKQIIIASGNTAWIRDISGKLLAELQKHPTSISEVNFSPNGNLIVTTSEFNSVYVWDTSGNLLAEIEGGFYGANFTPDGNRIVTVSTNKIPQLWNISGKLLAEFREGTEFEISSAVFSPDGKLIVTASRDKIARMWDLSGKLIAELKWYQGNINESIFFPDINNAIFSPDGKLIVTTTSSDNIARIWDTKGNLLLELVGHELGINSASFSPDGKFIVTASKDKTARVWDKFARQIAELKGHQGEVESAYFSLDGKLIVTASVFDNTRLWDISGKLLAELKEGDRSFIRTSSASTNFSPDGKLIVEVSEGLTPRIWSISGKLLVELKGHKDIISSANFSPDGKLIVTASKDQTARLWNLSGKLLAELKGHTNSVLSANFSPDGKLIVTVSADKTARVWDITGKLLVELKGHQDYVNSASFSPDSKQIVTASDDGTSRVWNTSGKQLAILSLASPPSSPKVEADRLRDLEFYAPNCAQALDPWQKALKIYQEISDNENQAVILEQLGKAHYCLSDYTKAIESYKNALEIATKFNYSQRQVNNLANLGNVYNSLADYETATKYYNDALKILEQYQDTQLKAEVLQSRGNIYIAQGKYNEAIQDLLQALAIDNNASSIAKTKVNLASVYYSLGDYNKAIQYYKEALELTPSEALGGLGNVYLALGDTAKAIEFHSSSLAKAQQNEDKEAEGNALNNLANYLRQAGKFAEAEKYLRSAIAIWENLRIQLDDANKISIFEKQTRTYRLLQEVLIAQNKITEALEISERGRARAFIDLLNKRLSPNQTEQSKLPAVNIEQIKQIAKNENATLVQYSIITDEFKVDGKLQTQESELYIWVIKPTGEVSFHSSDLKPLWQKENTTLAKLVTTSRQSIGVRGRGAVYVSAKPDATKAKQKLQRSHELLIKPIADILPSNPNDRVIFIPQGELFLVPFPALQYDQDKYLIEKHTILTAPSIQVLDFTSKQKRRVETLNAKSLIVGNPTMPKVELEPGKPPEQLKDLPWAEKEAKDIASILKTQALTGKQASKTAILQKISQAEIIHFATHGLLDDNRGLGSAIALAPSNKDNGLLTAEEILNLKLNADLVVLSACDTGRGRITGDGVIGLSRSLISAGVPSVIVSLWAVDDNSTSFLMTEFYNNLQQKLDKATALRKAMLTTMQKYPQPLNWAAFTLIGES